MTNTYTFSIDVFTPETLPAARFAEYVLELAKLLGEPAGVHFKEITSGSARVALIVDEPVQTKVHGRLRDLKAGKGSKDACSAQTKLDMMLANDNATGSLFDNTGAVILPFEGREKVQPLVYGPFSREATIEGRLVSLGGRDKTAHVQLQDGDVFHTKIEVSRDLAVQLRSYLYAEITIRLFGKGRYLRTPEGIWSLENFKATGFETLDDAPLLDVIAKLRSVKGSEWGNSADPVAELLEMRNDAGALH
jgi:hypothetical protein